MSLQETILTNAAMGTDETSRPWYHGMLSQTFSFTDHPTPRCPYYRSLRHALQHYPNPHACCRLAISCIIPTEHRNYGTNCPYTNTHLTDNNNNNEGYIGHQDEEGDSEA